MSGAASSTLTTSLSSTSSGFDVLILTASTPSQAEAFRSELCQRQERGLIPHTTQVLVVTDPAGVRIGSGGATMSSLYELLQTLPGTDSQAKLDRLAQLKIGMFHSGGDSQRLPTCSVRGKAFCGLPFSKSVLEAGSSPSASASDTTTNTTRPPSAFEANEAAQFESTPFDFLLARLSALLQCPGCIITATDCLLDLPEDYLIIRSGSAESQGVVAATIETPSSSGSNHGVFVVDAEKANHTGIYPVTHIMQKASQVELREAGAISASGTVLLDSGIIFLPPPVLQSLVKLAENTPFNTCLNKSNAAVHPSPASTSALSSLPSSNNNAAHPNQKEQVFRFELYTDLLLPMNPRFNKEQFLQSSPPDPNYPVAKLHAAREVLWEVLHGYTCYGIVHTTHDSKNPAATKAGFYHMGTMEERWNFMCSQDPVYAKLRSKHGFKAQTHTYYDHPSLKAKFTTTPNTVPVVTLNALLQCSDADVASLSVQPGSFIEYSHLEGRLQLRSCSMLSGVRSPLIRKDLRIPDGVCLQETQLERRVMHELKGNRLQGALVGDALSARVALQSGKAAQNPMRVVSIFHKDDSIKLRFDHAEATFLGGNFRAFIELIRKSTVNPSLGVDVQQQQQQQQQHSEQVILEQLWPGLSEDPTKRKQRNLWTAKLFPIFQASDSTCTTSSSSSILPPFTVQREHLLWMLACQVNGGSFTCSAPHITTTIQTWLDAPRLSFQDILGYSDCAAESLWRIRLASQVDVALLKQHWVASSLTGAHNQPQNAFYLSQAGKATQEQVKEQKQSNEIISTFLSRFTALQKGGYHSLMDEVFDAIDSFNLDVILQTQEWHKLSAHVRGVAEAQAWQSQEDATINMDIVGRIFWLQIKMLAIRSTTSSAPASSVTSLSSPVSNSGSTQSPSPSSAAGSASSAEDLQALEAQTKLWLRQVKHASFRSFFPRIIRALSLLRHANKSNPSHVIELYRLALGGVGRCAVATESNYAFTVLPASEAVPLGSTLELQGCVRLDCMGGWTDTPPVCYEHGGAVVNVSIQLDGDYPIRIEGRMEPLEAATAPQEQSVITIQMGLDKTDTNVVQLTTLEELHDFDQPTAPASLIKATLITMGLVDLDSPLTLAEQISQAFWKHHPEASSASSSTPNQRQQHVRLHLKSWIALAGQVAQGTGLGVSSILAADLVLVLGRLFHRVYTPTSVAHLVLGIEQALTTGGGWQDQVGGLSDGFKITTCPKGLPLRLETKPLPLSQEALRQFESHAIFVHTGVPRLAKNLLQIVLDCWHSRIAFLADRFDTLEAEAHALSQALLQNDWKQVGKYLQRFGEIKYALATDYWNAASPPPLPPHVADLITRLGSPNGTSGSNLLYGSSLAGAGGGGFLVLFAPPENHSKIHKVLEHFNKERVSAGLGECRTYRATVCTLENGNPCYRVSVRK